MQRNRLTCLGVVFAVICACAAQGSDPQDRGTGTAVTNLPSGLVLRDMTGRYVKLNEVCYPGSEQPRMPRQTLVLNFMQYNCVRCIEELPDLLSFLRESRTNRVAGFLISLDPLSKGRELEELVSKMGVDCGVLLDPYKVAAMKLGVVSPNGGGGIPRTFVIAPDGRIVADIRGRVDSISENLRTAVERAAR